jgi:uncharacterized membrane protein YgcG
MSYVTLGRGPCPTPRVRRNRRASPEVAEAARLSGYLVRGDNGVSPFPTADTLGFSLKPPKFIRKASVAIRRGVTLKRVAIAAGAVIAAPFVLPALAAGGSALLAAGRVGGGLLARGAVGLFKRNPSLPMDALRQAAQVPAGYSTTAPDAPPLTMPTGLPMPIAASSGGGGSPSAPGDFSPYGGGGGGGDAGGGSPSAAQQLTDESTPPATAGIGGGLLLPLAIGAGLLLLTRKRGR